MNQSDAKIWMKYSESDLRAAQTLLDSEEIFPRQICFLAQQCAEKAIKAILVLEEIDFPRSHDLDRLRDLIPDGWKVKEQLAKTVFDVVSAELQERIQRNSE